MNSEIIDCLDGAKNNTSNIMVVGVGGGGGNAVKHMYNLGIHNVMFMVCNTDVQALSRSPIPSKIQLGSELTSGLGAGNKPERGRDAAIESGDEIRQRLVESGARMIFITAGMGGGTGTGAAPVIAQIAKELNILTVSIVTIPFRAEGPRRINQAGQGIEEIRKYVDSLLIIDNENISRMYGDLSFSEAFGKADDILATAAKGIAEVITKEFGVNVDFADVQTTMSNSGVALMGSASCLIDETEDIAQYLTNNALISPLLNQNNIAGATNILVNISWKDKELRMNDVYKIISVVQESAGESSNVIWGAGPDDTLQESGQASVIIIATGFDFVNSDDRKNDMTELKPIAKEAPAAAVEESAPVAEAPAAESAPKVVQKLEEVEKRVERINADGEIVLKDQGGYVVPSSIQNPLPSEETAPKRNVVSLYDESGAEEASSGDDQYVMTDRSGKSNVSSAPATDYTKSINTQQAERIKSGELTIDEKDEVPAFLRRQMLASVDLNNAGEVNRVVIKEDN